jgi:trehalose/maltose hydrolase-like predicted phosphorylase
MSSDYNRFQNEKFDKMNLDNKAIERQKMISPVNWHIVEDEFPNPNYHHKETVFTIGNGYLSSRGSFEEGYPGENATTFVHGVFNHVPTFTTELVNFPKWFSLKIFLEGEEFRLDHGKILAYHRDLNMANGLLTRRVTWESPGKRQVTVIFERFLDMKNIHHAALRFTVADFNFKGQVEIHAGIPGVVSNERYRHWQHINQGQISNHGCFLGLGTVDTGIQAGIAESVLVTGVSEIAVEFWDAKWVPTLNYKCEVQPGVQITGTKHSAIYTRNDVADPLGEAKAAVNQFTKICFDEQLNNSYLVWQDLWERSNVVIKGDDLADQSLRYNLFQILIAAPRHTDTVSIGAKTLSGYGYRGHVFWDTEIFILPFLIYTQPAIARNLLIYRYRTLPGARKKAQKNGYKGAMYAWESAATGEEVTPTWVAGPDGKLVRIWCGDIEQHITADVAYAINQYWEVTGDDEFMRRYGVEVVLSAAQFYASRLEWAPESNSYHIRNVIGPDEYHEHVDDNAMTNLMAGWVLGFAKQVAEWFKEEYQEDYQRLLQYLVLLEEEIHSWAEMSEKIAIHVRRDGVIEQFEGYFDLTYLDQAALEPRKESLQQRYGIEGVQQYQFIKQPDVVMALYLLRDFYKHQQILQNIAYYSPRTDLSYGSSLGPSIQALMLARFGDVEHAKELFIKTLLTDLENNRGNTPEGIHAASAGAVWQVILFGFLGFRLENEAPSVYPNLPEGWERLTMQILWHNQQIGFDIN